MTERARASTESERAGIRRVAGNAFFLVLGQGATMALGVVYNGSLGRFLGANEFGLFFILSSFAAFAYVLVDWGQQRYVIRAVAQSAQRSGDLLGTGIVLRVAGTLLVCVPAGFAAWALGYGRRAEGLTVAFIVASLPFWLGQLYGMLFRGRDRMGLDAVVVVVDKSIALLLALTALYLGLGLDAIIIAEACAGGVALIVAMRLYRRVTSASIQFSIATAREMLTGGTALAATFLAVYAQSYIDAVLLSKLVPLDAVGWYAAAKTIMGALFAPASIVASVYFPGLSRAAKNPTDFTHEVRKALRPMLWLGGLTGVGTYLFADTAIRLIYGSLHFAPAANILRVFGPGLILLFMGVFFSHALTALGRERAFMVAKVCSVIVSTLLALILIPYFQRRFGNGGMGVVLAFVLSEFVVFASSLFLMPRGTLGSALVVDGARAIAAAALTSALFVVVPPMPSWLGIPICVFAFAALSWAVGLVRRADIDSLVSMARDRFVRATGARTDRGVPPHR
jgi:O-antigen/teichoic acid export membrane protein